MSLNVQHKIRIDLLELYDRLMRYTALRARIAPASADIIAINESDWHTVNPLLKLAFAKVSDDTGALQSFEDSGLDALTESGLKDYKLKLVDGAEDISRVIAVYNLPGKNDQAYVSAVNEFIYEAIVTYVMHLWFKHIAFYDVSQDYLIQYQEHIKQIKNAGPRFPINQRRKPVNL